MESGPVWAAAPHSLFQPLLGSPDGCRLSRRLKRDREAFDSGEGGGGNEEPGFELAHRKHDGDFDIVSVHSAKQRRAESARGIVVGVKQHEDPTSATDFPGCELHDTFEFAVLDDLGSWYSDDISLPKSGWHQSGIALSDTSQ